VEAAELSDRSYDEYVAAQLVLAPGTRVRLTHPGPQLSLRSDLGTVVRETEDDLYYIVRLDAPALYNHGDGTPQELEDVVEAVDNMDIVTE
jgi:hypothetical protein